MSLHLEWRCNRILPREEVVLLDALHCGQANIFQLTFSSFQHSRVQYKKARVSLAALVGCDHFPHPTLVTGSGTQRHLNVSTEYSSASEQSLVTQPYHFLDFHSFLFSVQELFLTQT